MLNWKLRKIRSKQHCGMLGASKWTLQPSPKCFVTLRCSGDWRHDHALRSPYGMLWAAVSVDSCNVICSAINAHENLNLKKFLGSVLLSNFLSSLSTLLRDFGNHKMFCFSSNISLNIAFRWKCSLMKSICTKSWRNEMKYRKWNWTFFSSLLSSFVTSLRLRL